MGDRNANLVGLDWRSLERIWEIARHRWQLDLGDRKYTGNQSKKLSKLVGLDKVMLLPLKGNPDARKGQVSKWTN